jgi:DNA-binding transcriptional regulator YiaG
MTEEKGFTSEDFRVACARLNMNYKVMAIALRISHATASNWANGKNPIPYAHAYLINSLLEKSGKTVKESLYTE